MPLPCFDTVYWSDDAPTWEPLEALARVLAPVPAMPTIEPADFLHMVCLVRPDDGLFLHLYKHIDTRQYLNLDDNGHAYRYRGVGSGAGSSGVYSPHRSIVDAIDQLDLPLRLRHRVERSASDRPCGSRPSSA